jgi:hypothetical protein
MFEIDEAREWLSSAGLFFGAGKDEDDRWAQTLNMNDVWGCAEAGAHYVSDEELPEVAELFWRYGWCGIVYWVSQQNDWRNSDLDPINRFIEFVRHEELRRV